MKNDVRLRDASMAELSNFYREAANLFNTATTQDNSIDSALLMHKIRFEVYRRHRDSSYGKERSEHGQRRATRYPDRQGDQQVWVLLDSPRDHATRAREQEDPQA